MVLYKVQMRMKRAVLAHFTIYLLSFKSSKGTKSPRKRVYMIMPQNRSHAMICHRVVETIEDRQMCVSDTQIEFEPWHLISNNMTF